jgi:hypothetical protein
MSELPDWNRLPTEDRRKIATERLLLARTARSKLKQRQTYARFPDENSAIHRLDNLIDDVSQLLSALDAPSRGPRGRVHLQAQSTRAEHWGRLSGRIAEIDRELAALEYLDRESQGGESMSVLQTVRNTLRSISGRHQTLSYVPTSETSIRETAKEAYKVVEALCFCFR